MPDVDMGLPTAARVGAEAIAARVFPGMAFEVGSTSGPMVAGALGAVSYDTGAAAVDAHTVYDMASLTKVLATAALVLHAVETARIRLDDPIARWIPQWTGADREAITVQDMLEHVSGLPAHRHYFETLRGRAAYERAICMEPLDNPPRTQAVYSDLGFMLLGFLLERAFDADLGLLFQVWRDGALGADAELTYCPPSSWRARVAPTEIDAAGIATHGVVHDENAAALGGVAGHAGLFGTADAVGRAARWWMRRLQLAGPDGDPARRFVQPSTVAGSSRALGWDTMRPTSSCGTRLSPRAIGHTGFTGTSLWIDPDADLYVVLLSNRVHPSRSGEGMARIRAAFHDAVVDDLTGRR